MSKEEFLKMAKAKYAEIKALKEELALLYYEKGFVKLWTELGRQVVEAELGGPGIDRRKKRKSKAPSELQMSKISVH